MLAHQQELQSRTSSLDQDDQELPARLAQATQQNKVIQDQVAALRRSAQ